VPRDDESVVVLRLADEGFLSQNYVGDPPVGTATPAPDTAPHLEHLVGLVAHHVAR
jgi:hypothetical protein